MLGDKNVYEIISNVQSSSYNYAHHLFFLLKSEEIDQEKKEILDFIIHKIQSQGKLLEDVLKETENMPGQISPFGNIGLKLYIS